MEPVPHKPLSFACQWTIISHMNANQRIHFSMQCPLIQAMEKSIPFKIDTLVLRPLEFELNGHVYKQEVWDAMEHLSKKIFNDRKSVKIEHLIIDAHGISEEKFQRKIKGTRIPSLTQSILDALPVDFKLKINDLEFKGVERQKDKNPMLPYAKSTRLVKNPRPPFNFYQLQMLQNEFDKSQHLLHREREELATELGLTQLQVKIWFQIRRMKSRGREPYVDDVFI